MLCLSRCIREWIGVGVTWAIAQAVLSLFGVVLSIAGEPTYMNLGSLLQSRKLDHAVGRFVFKYRETSAHQVNVYWLLAIISVKT